MNKPILFIFLFLLIFKISEAQNLIYKRVDSVKVIQYADTLNFPFAGGFNNPQFSEIDWNNDNIQDLFVYDRSAEKAYTFINKGIAGVSKYTYAPQYEKSIPTDLKDWVLIRDYNCDGVGDIFTYTSGGIKVYKGLRDANQQIYFVLASAQLQYNLVGGTHGNLYTSGIDIPALDDINGDGDLDILSFDTGGGAIMYYESQQHENYGTCNDSLKFNLIKFCWGKIFDANQQGVTLDFVCTPAIHNNPVIDETKNGGAKHSGNTLATFDIDGDGDKDCLKGNISFNTFNMLYNGGTAPIDSIASQDTTFPSNSVPFHCNIFPAGFFVDVNNDGKKDLLGAPNAAFFSENYNCSWLYKNTGTATNAVFTFQSDSFMISDMIEVGEGSFPVFYDYNNDGVKDLVIGNVGYYDPSGIYKSQLALYKNIGTVAHPAFQLISKDWNNFSALHLSGISPTFGDLDNDGDMDLIAGATDGKLNYFINNGSGNFSLSQLFYQSIDVGDMATPQLVDIDEDGLLDLIIGEKLGNLNFYKNTGTATAAVFTLQTNTFGGVDVRENGNLTGYSAPHFCKLTPTSDFMLLVGSEEGHVKKYDHIKNNLNGNFTLTDYAFSNLDVGYRSTICAADILGDDTLEAMIGNYRGGVSLFTYDTTVINSASSFQSVEQIVEIYPNPSFNSFQIDLKDFSNEKNEINICDEMGRICFHQEIKNTENSLQINCAAWASGVYVVSIFNSKTTTKAKLVVIH